MPRDNADILARDAAIAEVRAVYADLSKRPIERNCTLRTECCRFKLTGRTPSLTKGEALLAAKALRATGRGRLPAVDDGVCPMLHPQTSQCLIYADRPFGCRTHFCQAAGGPYTRREVQDFVRRLEKVDAALGGDGGHPLEPAVAAALSEFQHQR